MRNSFVSGNVQMQILLRQEEPLLVNIDGIVEVVVMEVNRVKFRDRIQHTTNLMNFSQRRFERIKICMIILTYSSTVFYWYSMYVAML